MKKFAVAYYSVGMVKLEIKFVEANHWIYALEAAFNVFGLSDNLEEAQAEASNSNCWFDVKELP